MRTLARLDVKIGGIGRTSRTSVRVDDPEFSFDDDTDSYDTFCASVEARVAASLQQYEAKTTREDTTIYCKPSQSAAQKNWVAMGADNFHQLVDEARSNYNKRKKKVGPFVIEMFAFARKNAVRQQHGVRRATASRIQEAARSIDGYLERRPDVRLGEIARTHWAVSHARQPEGSSLSLPDSATFAQAQHLDELRAGGQSASPGDSDYQTITVRLNGSSDLQLTVNVRELRRALGIPHNLLAEGVFHSFVPPAEPDDDVDDIDHLSE